MKLSKSNEDTLKGVAALLKLLKSDDLVILTSGTSQRNEEAERLVTAMDKDLRQLRKSLKELPEPGAAPTEPNAVMRQLVFDEMAQRLALPDGEADRIGAIGKLCELNLIVGLGANPCAQIEIPEPAQPSICVLGMDWWEVAMVNIYEAPVGAVIEPDMKRAAHIALKVGHGERWDDTKQAWVQPDNIEPQVGQIESEFEEVPACYANKMQILKQQSLIGVTYAEPDENRSLPLYRKKS